ncbi:hypothetical protein E2C01_054867 [Portunus trituberculatus]|uniref:Uncharacterized protein n=1 Tax=Portunus trituberculatus TaxID=210409 RepID=A0A5B7GKY8_PORTR|nr:hypothetical protein [Portunus trituberculatus]
MAWSTLLPEEEEKEKEEEEVVEHEDENEGATQDDRVKRTEAAQGTAAPPRSPYCQISFSLGEDTTRVAELKEAGLAALLKGMIAAGGPAGGGEERAIGGGRRKGRLGFHLLLGLALAGTTWQTAAAPHTTGILLATFLPKFISTWRDLCRSLSEERLAFHSVLCAGNHHLRSTHFHVCKENEANAPMFIVFVYLSDHLYRPLGVTSLWEMPDCSLRRDVTGMDFMGACALHSEPDPRRELLTLPCGPWPGCRRPSPADPSLHDPR